MLCDLKAFDGVLLENMKFSTENTFRYFFHTLALFGSGGYPLQAAENIEIEYDAKRLEESSYVHHWSSFSVIFRAAVLSSC